MKTGVAFGDYISTEKIKKRKNYDNFDKPSERKNLVPIIIILAISLIFIRLINLQVLSYEKYKTLSDENRTRTVVVHAPRGIILDRNNVPLTFNIPGFRKLVDGKVELISTEDAIKRLARGEKGLEVDSLRDYPYKDATSHVLGYVGQISQGELREEKYQSYNSGDIVGKMGIEQFYETTLRGKDGKELVEVDSLGNEIRKLGKEDPIPGQDIQLTIDIGIQQSAFLAAKDIKKGAVIVSNPKGEILAMISKPSFDPNLLTHDPTYKAASESGYLKVSDILLDSSNQPLLDRGISGLYPPGSTFKLVAAAAGLEGKIIDDKFTVEDTGVIKEGAFSFANWYYTQYGKTEGDVDVVKGIQRSNDIFFYKLAEKIGIDRLSEKAGDFGLGKILGIDLPGEKAGLVPTEEWKKETVGEQWYLGDTYHYGIGQGFLLTTPLQVSAWTQAFTNKGKIYQPHILKDKKEKVIKNNSLSDETLSLIRQGMIEACSPGGVAWPFFDFKVKNPKLKIDGKNFLEIPESSTSGNLKDFRKVSVACKTGTAEQGGPNDLPHAWITLFAPAYNPEIVVTVLSEASGEGSNMAAPVAQKILDYYFSKQN